MHANAERQLVIHAFPYLEEGMRVLEAGPDDEAIVKNHIEKRGCIYEWYDVKTLPPSEDYDAVISSNVIEHVKRPWRFIAQQFRLLKPGGILICGCPNSWRYHRSETDDYFRIWAPGLRVLLEDAGFAIEITVQSADNDSVDSLVLGRKL